MNQSHTRRQRATIGLAILCLILLLVVLQFWLLSATMNAYQGGDDSVLWPAALASAICCLFNARMLIFLRSFEKSLTRDQRR